MFMSNPPTETKTKDKDYLIHKVNTPSLLVTSDSHYSSIPSFGNENNRMSASFIGNIYLLALVLLGGISLCYFLVGIVIIKEDKVGIAIKKIDADSIQKMKSNRVIAFNNEAGIQADVLSPGVHHGFYFWKYNVLKEDWVVIPQGEIALIIAQDGAHIPAGRTLGKVVDCEDFQDAQAFLRNGGEKGQQLSFLTTGTYRINTKLFTVITAKNASQYGLNPGQLSPCIIPSDKVGIVVTHDGAPIPSGEIAGPIVGGHDKFQDPRKFIENGGCRGLQQEILPSGTWDLNPWFAEVEKASLVDIPPGTVGVVISHVGQLPPEGKADDLVDAGFKGVWKTPLRNGKHPVNTKVMSIEIVPIHEIALDWKSDKSKNPLNYDANLNSLSLRSKDGFPFDIEVTQVIKVPEESAPRMISRVGSPLFETDGHPSHSISGTLTAPKYTSIKNLVTRVLKPMVENHFRNSVQQYGALEFLDERSDRQKEAALQISEGLVEYGVRAVGTYLNEIDLPPDLEKALTERKIAEQQQKTFKAQQAAESERQKLAREKELTEIQQLLVKAEEGLKIAKLEAESQKFKGIVEIDILREKILAFGPENYAAVKIMETISNNQMRLVPELSFDSKDNYGSVLLQWLVGSFLKPRNMSNSEVRGEAKEDTPFSPAEMGTENDYSDAGFSIEDFSKGSNNSPLLDDIGTQVTETPASLNEVPDFNLSNLQTAPEIVGES